SPRRVDEGARARDGAADTGGARAGRDALDGLAGSRAPRAPLGSLSGSRTRRPAGCTGTGRGGRAAHRVRPSHGQAPVVASGSRVTASPGYAIAAVDFDQANQDEAIRATWDRRWSECSHPNAFHASREWAEYVNARGARVRVLVVRDGAAVTGVCPLM